MFQFGKFDGLSSVEKKKESMLVRVLDTYVKIVLYHCLSSMKKYWLMKFCHLKNFFQF